MDPVVVCDRSLDLVLRSSTSVWQSESMTVITIPDDDIKICLDIMKKNVPPGEFPRVKLLAITTPNVAIPNAAAPCEIEIFDSHTMAMIRKPCLFASGSHSRQDMAAWSLVHCLESFRTSALSVADFNRYILPIQKKLDSSELPAADFAKAWDDQVNPTRISIVESIEAEFKTLFTKEEASWPNPNPLFIKKKREEDLNGDEISYKFGNGSCKVSLRCHRVDKLRAVTALKGFKRLVRDANGNEANIVPLSHRDESLNQWFAAVKAQGEGILITFDDDSNLCDGGGRWNKWQTKFASLVGAPMDNRYLYRGLRTEPLTVKVEEEHVAESHPMFVWWHTLAHHLIRTIQHDTGYSSSAISERIYAQEVGGKWTGGILLYVTEGGMDGTLGGLTSLVPNLQKYLDIIAQESDNCSNDPLCTDVTSSSLEHDRACYSCTYNSETSCGHRNLFLDRLLLRECAGLK
jgi:hypothetical protein